MKKNGHNIHILMLSFMLIIMYYLGTEVSRKQTSTYELNNKVQ